jgi:hypothetical protein
MSQPISVIFPSGGNDSSARPRRFANNALRPSWIINYTVCYGWLGAFFKPFAFYRGRARSIVGSRWQRFCCFAKLGSLWRSSRWNATINSNQRTMGGGESSVCPIEKRHMYKLHCCGNESECFLQQLRQFVDRSDFVLINESFWICCVLTRSCGRRRTKRKLLKTWYSFKQDNQFSHLHNLAHTQRQCANTVHGIMYNWRVRSNYQLHRKIKFLCWIHLQMEAITAVSCIHTLPDYGLGENSSRVASQAVPALLTQSHARVVNLFIILVPNPAQ